MSNYNNPISEIMPNTRATELILSAFDLFDRAIAIFDANGLLIDINKHALDAYGVKEKKAFLDTKPNFFDSHSFKTSFDYQKLATKDITTKVFFDYDKFNEDFPDIGFKKGKSLHYLRIHPIFDESRLLRYIVVFSTDMTSLKKDRKTTHQLRDNLPMMMNEEGISTWTYDIASGRRILDAGSHLFPELQYMDDFLKIINQLDSHVLNNIIMLMRFGKKMEGHALLRVPNDSGSAEKKLYLETFCIPQIVENEVVGIFFMTKDVTLRVKKQFEAATKDKKMARDRYKLESSNMLLHSLMDRLPCLFYVKDVDKDFRYFMANSLFCDHVGKTVSQILGHTDEEVIPLTKEQLSEFRRDDISAIAKGSVTCREETCFKGNRKVWRTTKYYIETAERRRLVVGISQEITDIYDAYDEIESAKVEAERSDKMKTVFLQNLSHELITPLNTVLGFSQLLLEPSTDDERAQYGELIAENGAILKDIIEEIIELSEIESGVATSRREIINLSEFFRNIRDKYAPKVRQGVDFKLIIPQEECVVSLDERHLAKLVHRGILTSIEYTYHGFVSIGFTREEGGVRVFVEDSGMGLSEEEMSAITDCYEKMNGFTESLAFSLSICRIITKIMGGTIDLSSSKGETSKVSVWLPC